MSKIELEPGRLALRKPELGGFLMVEVESVEEDRLGEYVRYESDCTDPASDFLPVLRPGDVVPFGSLLLAVTDWMGGEWECGAEFTHHPDDGFHALLRYGPEEDA